MKTLEKIITACNINKGDMVLLSSDAIRLFSICVKEDKEFNADILLDAFSNQLGEDGTLLLPTYNWGFCKGLSFDYKKTKGVTGALGNAALKRKDYRRTKHPIYSFAVWGRYKEEICSLANKDSFGEDSIFAYMHHHNACNVLLDVDYNHSFTFLHYVEQMAKCQYRYIKDFTADYIDENDIRKMQTYSMYVRNLDMNVHMFLEDTRFEDYLIKHADATIETINGITVRKVFFDKAYDAIWKDVVQNESRNACYFEKRTK